MNDYQKLSLILSTIALGLSLLSFMWTIGWSVYLRYRPHRTVLKIRPHVAGMQEGDKFKWFLKITVVNVSTITATLDRVCISVPRTGKELHPYEWQAAGGNRAWPCRLEANQPVESPLVPFPVLAKILTDTFGYRRVWRLHLIAYDSLGRKHKKRVVWHTETMKD